jgi:hypothetical protein
VVTFVISRCSEFLTCAIFDVHVLELAGLEDFAAVLAFDELGVLIAAYDLHAKMLARLRLDVLRRRGRL